MHTLTDEQKKDVEERTKQFKERLVKLSDELKVDIYPFPQFVVDQNDGSYKIVAQVMTFDTKYLPVKSPVQKKPVIES